MSTKQDHKRWRKEFNEACLKRDKHKCVFCDKGDKPEKLDVHHITNRHNMPNGGYAPSNGITLCSSHHLLAEEWLQNREWVLSVYSSKELYEKIGSSYEKALQDSENLK